MNNKIIIINGPNLNLLGEREQSQYGSTSFKELKENCIKKSNEHGIPQKFWDYEPDTGRIWHGADEATDTPIREQALMMLRNNTFTTGNTQYFKIANQDFEHWEQPLRDLFPNLKQDKLGISLFVQPPGSMHWSHTDTYTSFIRRRIKFVSSRL